MNRRFWRLPLGLVLSGVSFVWRRLMFGTTFVAVTGSVGKTTATRCLAAILSERFPTNATPGSQNHRLGLARTILRTRFSHRFTVIEVATRRVGAMWRACLQVKPDIVVMLSVARTHSHRFPNLEVIAREKAQLLRRLGARGTAVLNGEDPRVLAMAAGLRCRVIRFGLRPEFDIWASEISSQWPARLSFRVHSGGRSYAVTTQLAGEHWVHSVLGALAGAVACGVPLEQAAARVAHVEPYLARLQPAPLPNGAVMLRDEYEGSGVTLDAAFRVLGEARGCRRVVVHGDIWDTGLEPRERYQDLGRRAAEAADVAVFVGDPGPEASRAALAHGMEPANVHAFPELGQASAFLRAELRAGDLVLLKGKTEEHLSRLYFAQLGAVQCWKKECALLSLCDHCPKLWDKTTGEPQVGRHAVS